MCKCVSACVWACVPFQSPHLDAHKKRLSWKSPAVDVIVLWLFPYLGRFNILFCCLTLPAALTTLFAFTPSFRNARAHSKPKHSLCLYHQPRETLGPVNTLENYPKTNNFQSSRSGDYENVWSLRSSGPSRWWCWTLWAGLPVEHFMEPILGLEGDQDVIECVSGLLNPLTGWQSQHRQRERG